MIVIISEIFIETDRFHLLSDPDGDSSSANQMTD